MGAALVIDTRRLIGTPLATRAPLFTRVFTRAALFTGGGARPSLDTRLRTLGSTERLPRLAHLLPLARRRRLSLHLLHPRPSSLLPRDRLAAHLFSLMRRLAGGLP